MGGGSSVGWPTGASSKDLASRAVSDVERSEYESEIAGYFQDLLADFNNRDKDAINRHLETIGSAIGKEFNLIDLLFGGSIKKNTYVDGISDVDILAVIDRADLVDKSPSEIIDYFASILRERLPHTEIKKGTMSVTIRFSDGFEIQVLPSSRTQNGFRIASSDGTRWSGVIDPQKFADKLTSINKANQNKVVPVTKLYKAINNSLPEDVKLRGYHIESLAIEAFENYIGPNTWKDMVIHLTEYASKAVLEPIKDSTGQSVHVDDELGPSGSSERLRASASINRILTRMKVADKETSIDRWMELMGE